MANASQINPTLLDGGQVRPGGRARLATAAVAKLEVTAFVDRRVAAEAPLRAVSTVAFAIGGSEPFERAITKSIDWMRMLNPAIPIDARTGIPFDIGGAGVPLARAVSVTSAGGRLWSATIDVADNEVPGRTWVTEITVGQRLGSDTHFGSRLFNVSAGADVPFVPSVPNVARWIVRDLPCGTDGVPLAAEPNWIDGSSVDDLLELLTKPTRRLPVVVVAEPLSRPLAATPEMLSTRLPGAAHVVGLSDEAARELTRVAGKQLSVFDGAVRVYLPDFTLDEADPHRHPLWIRWPNQSDRLYQDEIISRAIAVSAARGSGTFPRFQAVREAAAAGEIEARREDSSGEELGRLYQEENGQLRQQLDDLRAEQDLWLTDAEVERARAASTVSELETEVARMRAQVDTLRAALGRTGVAPAAEPLEHLAGLADWSAKNASNNVWFAPKAIKAAERLDQYRMPSRIGDAIRMLDELYVPMRLGDEQARAAYEARMAELALEDAACFARENDILNFPEYGVTYRGRKFWCDRHLKHGGGTDPRSMFRIYYHWLADEHRVLIGHLPSHLDNNLTN